MNGKRIKDQLCLSHPDVLEHRHRHGSRRRWPRSRIRHVWSVSQNDNFSYCQCPDCRKAIEEEGSRGRARSSGSSTRWRRGFPTRPSPTLAYQYSRQAPQGRRVRRRNVQIMLCTIELNRSLPIADDPSSRSFLQDIADWGTISRNIYLWDYTVNFSHHVSPFPNLHVLQPNLRFFVRNGAGQHFQQSNTGAGHEFSELKALPARAPALEPGPAMPARSCSEFLDGYYGAASPWIADVHRRAAGQALAAQRRETGHLRAAGRPCGRLPVAGQRDARYNEWFDRAEAAVRADPERLERVKTAQAAAPVRDAGDRQERHVRAARLLSVEAARRFAPRPEMTRLLEDFFAACRSQRRAHAERGRADAEAILRGHAALHRRAGRGQPGVPQAGRGRAAAVARSTRAATLADADRRRSRARATSRSTGSDGKGADFDLMLDLGASCAGERGVDRHPLGRAQLDSASAAASRALVSADGSCATRTLPTQARRGRPARRGRDADVHLHTGRRRASGSSSSMSKARRQLPAWHASAGGTSWVFVDEIVAR